MTIQNNLSTRAAENLTGSNVMLEGVIKANADKFDFKENPNGIINLGVAENQLMTAELREIVSERRSKRGVCERKEGSMKRKECLARRHSLTFLVVLTFKNDDLVLEGGHCRYQGKKS